MKVSTHLLSAFAEVFRQRSISRAAGVLGVTQSAVTQSLAKLERQMGTRLFVRNRSGLEPTKPAFELFALADRLQIIEQLVTEKVGAYGALASGHLSIIANAPRPAMPLIAEFTSRYPGVRISFTLVSWTVALQKLMAREVDIAIVTEPGDVAGLYKLELESGSFIALLREDHSLAGRSELCLADLVEVPVVLPEEGSLTQRVVFDGMRAAGVQFKRLVEMTTYPVVKEAVMHGIGVGIMLQGSVLLSPDIVERPIADLDQRFRTFLVTSDDKQDLRFVRAFVEVATP
jgi:LysR family transcriptional regulator, low CO2-responsive transcriptional regulator